MKKLFYSLFALAMTAMTFTSCEDVPAPYDDPNNNQGGGGTTVIDPAGQGTQDDPFNVIAAINYAKNLEVGAESPQVYIKGIVVSIAENYTTQYGNARFYISDDGTARNQFLIYRALYLGNKKYTEGDILQEGDSVIICGIITNYNGTFETQQNKAFLYSLNGKSEGGGGGGATGEAKGSGTLDDPYNPAGVIAYVNSLGADNESPIDVYIKGKVGSITEQYGTQYGNATFTIVEEGAEGSAFTVFRALYLGNKKYSSGDLLKEGDDVIVCGKVVNFKGNTPETAQGKAYLYSLNGKSEGGGGGGATGEAKGSGTLADPYNAVAANNYASSLAADAKSDKDVYIKGKISKIANNGEFGTQYGNASFYISDDGTTNNEFYVFRTLYLGNKKYDNTSDPNIKVGDEVIICGKVVNYKGNTPETSANESYIYSLNGKTEGGGGGGGESGEIKTVTIAEFNAASESTSVWYKLSGTVKNLKDGDQFGNFDLEDNTGSVYVYGLLSEKGGEKKQFQTLASEKGIKNGVKITIIGNRGSYNDKIEVTNAYFVSVDGEGGGGGEQPSGAGTYDSPLTVAQAIALGSADAAWVKGYIVGYVAGQVLSTGATFSAEPPTNVEKEEDRKVSNTNLLIASSASETDVSKCMPIQLSRDYRADFALDANSDMLGKQVIVAGQLTKYFGVAGIKSPTYMEANGKSVGNKVRYRKRK
ncbi:MAG: OB-fold nucleic acid binding domain-containing protein [Prevotella sp.]|nr:OB-fold nucleic acid binding domain-containing protein [Prevotella sp.]